MRGGGATVQTVNRAPRTMKAILFFALERELIERNVMQRFWPFDGDKSAKCRDAFSESEVRSILEVARPAERALIGLLCFTGLALARPMDLTGRRSTWRPDS